MKRWILILLFGAVMTTYNTGNAVGSTDARDLSDNAKNLDFLSLGAEMEYPDRLGVPRKSWAGLEQQVADFLASQGWEAVTIQYAADAIVERPTQLVERDGELYRVALQSDLPLTLSGTWATDAPKLVAVGNQPLRSELATNGYNLVGSNGQMLSERLTGIDTAIAEAASDASKAKNSNVSAYSLFGGQLAKLKADLADPLQQFVSITLVGDSITWGMSVTGGGPVDPRNGTLTDQRNNGASPSWANLLHKYLGYQFLRDSTAVGTRWSGASGGANIFQYSRTVELFPGLSPISFTGEWTTSTAAAATLGQQFDVNTTTSPGNNSFQFVMSGTGFTMVFAATNGGAQYRVLVNGVLQGTYATDAATLGVPIGYKNTRIHNFGTLFPNATIRVEAVDSTGLLRIEAVRLDKTLQVVNQGIIGTTFTRYTNILIPSGAIPARSKYVFVQLGTNDRAETVSNTGQALTPAALRIRIDNFLAAVAGLSGEKNVILIAANEVSDSNQDQSVYRYSMADVRNALFDAAKVHRLDFIDQYALTRTLLGRGVGYLADGLHPNDVGHDAMFSNIREAIEHAYIAPMDAFTIKKQTGSFSVSSAPAGYSTSDAYSMPFTAAPQAMIGYRARIKLSTETEYGPWVTPSELNVVGGGNLGGATNAAGTVALVISRFGLTTAGATRVAINNRTAAAVTVNVEIEVFYL